MRNLGLSKLIDIYKMSKRVMTGELSYYDFSVEVRKPEYLMPQIIYLSIFFTIACFIVGFPLWANLVLLYALITGILMIRKAYTIKKQFIMCLLWGLQAFVVGLAVMVLMVYLGKI